MAFSSRELPEAEKCADEAKARAKALELTAARELCSGELYAKLCRRFTERAAAAAVAEALALGYIDDERYAEVKARALFAARKSRRAAADALRRKGLGDDIVCAAVEAAYAEGENGEDADLVLAEQTVERSYLKKLADGRRDLVIAALLRRGFSCGTAIKAIEAAEAQVEA